MASAIARELNNAGLDVHSAEISGTLLPEDYDSFVIGSPLYGGSWVSSAGIFAAVMSERMNGKPVALFSVGTLMLKSPNRGRAEHVSFIQGLRDVAPDLNIVADDLFAGYFDRGNLPWWLRLVDRFAPTPQGDHRDWPKIREWTKSLVPEFSGRSVPGDPKIIS